MTFLPIPDSPEPKLGSKLISFLSRMKHRWAILRARAAKRNRRTVMTIEHRRRLGLSGVALTGARNKKHEIKSLTAVRDRLEGILDEDGFLLGAPFSWVTISIRYGLVDASEPSYQAINQKYGDLPMSIEAETDRLVGLGLEALTAAFREAVLVALIHAGRKYSRPTTRLEEMLNEELRQGKQ